jgi:hypothetical protein
MVMSVADAKAEEVCQIKQSIATIGKTYRGFDLTGLYQQREFNLYMAGKPN